MKQLVILSGKGGTGKTSVAAALAHLASAEWKVILADDCPNTDCGYPSSVEMSDGKIVSLYNRVDDLSNAPASASCAAVLWQAPE